jgi:AcrR family transcriptional regulator
MRSSAEERRSRQVSLRRREILESAARVFARRGFNRATTRDIAQEAEVAEGTIYNYFASKQELVTALVDLVRGEFASLLASMPPEGSGHEFLARSMLRVLDIIYDNAVAIRGLVSAMWDQFGGLQGYLVPGSFEVIRAAEAYLKAGIVAGRLRPCDTQAVARMMAGMVIFVAMPYLRGPEPIPAEGMRRQQAELIAGVLLDGLLV